MEPRIQYAKTKDGVSIRLLDSGNRQGAGPAGPCVLAGPLPEHALRWQAAGYALGNSVGYNPEATSLSN